MTKNSINETDNAVVIPQAIKWKQTTQAKRVF